MQSRTAQPGGGDVTDAPTIWQLRVTGQEFLPKQNAEYE
jgi:hypothetical protein